MRKRERHIVYKRILARFKHCNRDPLDLICNGLCREFEREGYNIEYFPELVAKATKKSKANCNQYWWSKKWPYGYNKRIAVLKECIEETKPLKK